MADHFYADILLQGRKATLLITSDRQWKLVGEDAGINFEKTRARAAPGASPRL